MELGAFSLATAPAFLWLGRANLRIASILATVLVIAGNARSALVTNYWGLAVVPWEVVNTRGRKKTSGKDGVYYNAHRSGGLHVPP